MFSAANNIVLAARNSGKWKAIFQFIVINLVLIFTVVDAWIAKRGAAFDLGTLRLTSELMHESAWWAMFVMALVTGLSGIDYMVGAGAVLKKLKM
jgi:phosphatidylglycerophosphate synthase